MIKEYYKVVYKVVYKDGRPEEIIETYQPQHFIDVEPLMEHKRYSIVILSVDYNDKIVGKQLNWFRF